MCATSLEKLEHLLCRTFASLTVIGETSKDYDANVCFQTLNLHSHDHHEHKIWMDDMVEVASHVSAQDCFLFCTIEYAASNFQLALGQQLAELGLNDIHPLYHSGKGRVANVTFRLSDVGKLLK